jgi:DNA-binding beta-propeller fold protein YncE
VIRRFTGALALVAAAQISLPPMPVLPGSTLPISVTNLQPPFDVAVLGPGSVTSSYLTVSTRPKQSSVTVVAGNAAGLAMSELKIAPTPDPSQPFIAVASYDDGVVIHQATPPFAKLSVLGVGGSPSDVAIGDGGRLAAAATNADSASIATIAPWNVTRFAGVPFVDEVAFDSTAHAVFLTNRDVDGAGALTRIDADGTVRRRVLGLTDEGLAIDAARGLVYVANVNDGTISIVDASTMVELRRVRAVSRVFGLALSPDGKRLYATSNQSTNSPFAAPGGVVALDTASARPHVVARSGPLGFPLGVVLDAADRRLFVTDERDDVVDVLDPTTLRPVHAPLHTCRTPWKPSLDDGLLYVPCARADEVDVIDARTLRRVRGAPFATGGYPLSVAVFHGSGR